MTLTTNIRHRSDARRSSAMIAMTVVAGRRRKILFVVKSFCVHARFVLGVLVARDSERPDVIRAGVALCACIGDVRGIDRGEWITDSADTMNAVATDAGGDACLAFLLEQFAVHACVVFAFLIDAQAGIEPLHQVRVAVALAAISRDVERLWFSEIASARIFRACFRVVVWIAAMTIVARQAARFVNVVVEGLGGGA